jgi:ribose 5-phosphate isomerase B
MKLFIASDHAGFELKAQLTQRFQKEYEVQDLGTDSKESCDYPLFAKKLSEALLKDSGALGLLICGTGVGMSIAANKIHGIRATCVSEPLSARMSREHNQANVLCLGARVIDINKAEECLRAFLNAKFDTSNPRHQRRVEQINELEK